MGILKYAINYGLYFFSKSTEQVGHTKLDFLSVMNMIPAMLYAYPAVSVWECVNHVSEQICKAYLHLRFALMCTYIWVKCRYNVQTACTFHTQGTDSAAKSTQHQQIELMSSRI